MAFSRQAILKWAVLSLNDHLLNEEDFYAQILGQYFDVFYFVNVLQFNYVWSRVAVTQWSNILQ